MAIGAVTGRQVSPPDSPGHESLCSFLRGSAQYRRPASSFSWTTACLFGYFAGCRADIQLFKFCIRTQFMKDTFQCTVITPATETAVYGLVRSISCRKVFLMDSAAGNPQNAVKVSAKVLLRSSLMMLGQHRLYDVPFCICYFIPMDRHAITFFCPPKQNPFVSFSCLLDTLKFSDTP